MLPDQYPYALMHVDGCEGIAFHLKRKPSDGDALSVDDMMVHGRQPVDGQQILCEKCGKALMMGELRPQYVEAKDQP